MAETIGRAYVRILADGSELGPDIERELHKAEKAFSDAGDKHAKSYEKAFDEEMKKSPTWAKLTQRLNRSFAKANVAHAFFEGDAWKNIVKQMEDEHGPELAKKLSDSFEQEFRRKGSLDGLEHALEDSTGRLSTIIERDLKKASSEVEKSTKKATDSVRKTFTRTEKDAESFARRFNRIFDSVSDRIAVGFGKGARNDFLNIIGRMQGALIKLAGVPIKAVVGGVSAIIGALGSLTKRFNHTSEAAEQAGEQVAASMSGSVVSAVASGGASIVAGLIAISFALIAVAGSAGTLVSALVLLGGTIVALVSTVAFAAGELLAFAPLLIPIAAIIGGVVISFNELKNASGPLKASMDKVKKTAIGLKDAFAHEAFKNSGKLFDRINHGLERLKPIMSAAGHGFRLFIDQLVKGFDNPVFQRFIDKFAKFLPGAMKQLGTISSNVLGGLSGVLTALIPSAQRLLNWFSKITEQFSNWASTKQGREDIRNFMDRAGKSAQALGHFLDGAWNVLKNLLSPGQKTGDDLFTKMGDQLQRVATWLQEHPDAVTQWFADAESFATSLGHVIDDIRKAIDKLDTPAHRVFAVAMVEAIGEVIVQIGNLIVWISKIASVMLGVAIQVVKAFGEIQKIVLGTIGVILTGLNKLPFGVGGVSDQMLASFNKFKDGAEGGIDSVVSGLESMKKVADAGAALHLDTSGASAAVASLSAQVDALLAKARQSPKSPTAVEHGVQQGGQTSHQAQQQGGTNTGAVQPHGGRIAAGSGVTINVTTPTKDPVAVANETVNRLIGVGYAQ